MLAATIPSRSETTTSAHDVVRADILRKAMELFQRKGFRATSMNDIAQLCGFTKPGIYYYFKNKSEFLEILYDFITKEFYDKIDILLASKKGAEDKITELVRAQVDFSMENDLFQGVLMEGRKELTEPARSSLRARERNYEERVRGLIEQGRRDGAFRDVDPHLAMMSILGLLSSVHRWSRYADRPSNEVADMIVDIVQRTLLRADRLDR